eukprot:917554-Pyramimonas_sp.AAC.1
MQSPSEILEICPSERALPGAHRTLRSVVWSNMVHRPLHHIIAPRLANTFGGRNTRIIHMYNT